MSTVTAPTIDPLSLLESLIGFPTVSSSSNAAITDYLSDELAALGFQLHRSDYRDERGVTKSNLVAVRDPPGWRSLSDGGPAPAGGPDPAVGDPAAGNLAAVRDGALGVAYFAHTDVVPADSWSGPGEAFSATVTDDRVYGRGSCDMKGSLVAMIAAVSMIDPAQQIAPLRIVCTADEEIGFAGARQLVAHSAEYRQMVREQPLAIIGEPTRCRVIHAHKGIRGYRLTSLGRAAHSSSRDGLNANLAMVPMLGEIVRQHQLSESEPIYRNDRFDPPTITLNFGVSDHCRTLNITPERSDAWVSIRTMPAVDTSSLVAALESKAAELGIRFTLDKGGPPMWVDPDHPAIVAVCRLVGQAEAETVCYATDGGELGELKNRLVCGPGDIAQAHTSDEWLGRDQLQQGIELYHRILQRWCLAG